MTPREAVEAIFKPVRAAVDIVDQATGELVLGHRPQCSELDTTCRSSVSPGHCGLVTGCVESFSLAVLPDGRLAIVRDALVLSW
jgi:hypothetical protein